MSLLKNKIVKKNQFLLLKNFIVKKSENNFLFFLIAGLSTGSMVGFYCGSSTGRAFRPSPH